MEKGSVAGISPTTADAADRSLAFVSLQQEMHFPLIYHRRLIELNGRLARKSSLMRVTNCHSSHDAFPGARWRGSASIIHLSEPLSASYHKVALH